MSTEVIIKEDTVTCREILRSIKLVIQPLVIVGMRGGQQEFFRVRVTEREIFTITIEIMDPYHDGIYDYNSIIEFSSRWCELEYFIDNNPPGWDGYFYDLISQFVVINKKLFNITKPGRFTL